MRSHAGLSKQDALDLAFAIREKGAERIEAALWSIVSTSKNDAARVAALALLASHGWGRPLSTSDIHITHERPEERAETRRLADWLAEKHPDVARELAWQEQRVLPAGEEVVDAERVQ